MSRICEEFDCLPSQAQAEIERTPWPLLLEIMELRAFARTAAELKQMGNDLDAPRTPLVQLVWAVQARAWQRRAERWRREHGELS